MDRRQAPTTWQAIPLPAGPVQCQPYPAHSPQGGSTLDFVQSPQQDLDKVYLPEAVWQELLAIDTGQPWAAVMPAFQGLKPDSSVIGRRIYRQSWAHSPCGKRRLDRRYVGDAEVLGG